MLFTLLLSCPNYYSSGHCRQPGRTLVCERLPSLRRELGLDFVAANAENAAGGSGLTGEIARALHHAGVDIVTLGDHVWTRRILKTKSGA